MFRKLITREMIESISSGSAKTDTPIFSAKRLDGGCLLLCPQRFRSPKKQTFFPDQ